MFTFARLPFIEQSLYREAMGYHRVGVNAGFFLVLLKLEGKSPRRTSD